MHLIIRVLLFYILYSINGVSTSVSPHHDKSDGKSIPAKLLCISRKDTLIECEDKSTAACVGAWGGDIKSCSRFSHGLLYVPVCVESSTSYIFTCGSISNLYLCFSNHKADKSIRPCNDIYRRVCLIKSHLRSCRKHHLKNRVGYRQPALHSEENGLEYLNDTITNTTNFLPSTVNVTEPEFVPNENFFFILCHNCSVKSGVEVDKGAFSKAVTLSKRMFTDG